MITENESKMGETPRIVVRGVNSQTVTEVSVHWLRISFPDKYLHKVVDITKRFFESVPVERFGLWGYDRAYRWPNGVRIIYDVDDEKAEFHNHRAYFECPGRSCDELTPSDLCLLMEIFKDGFEGRGERIDICLDDFSRRIEPQELQVIAKRKDYSRFRQFHLKQSYDNGNKLVYDSVVFGSQKKGWIKQLEVYDKRLESDGEIDSVRWEAKFREDKADTVFTKLAGTCGDLEAFALLCGCIVVGSITFVHRIEGLKNLDRLDEYEFWQLLKEGLGELRIRTAKKKNTLTGVIEWTKRQVSPSLACIRRVFVSERQFFGLLRDLLDDGDSRMNANQRHIVEQYAGSMTYDSKVNWQSQENDYINLMCDVK